MYLFLFVSLTVCALLSGRIDMHLMNLSLAGFGYSMTVISFAFLELKCEFTAGLSLFGYFFFRFPQFEFCSLQ